MKKRKNKINEGHYLELMDRIHVVTSLIDDHILSHPLTENKKNIKKKITKAIGKLYDAYQYVGDLEYKKSKK
jgi:hypothetical protein